MTVANRRPVHSEGLLEVFANLYSEFAMAVAHRIAHPGAPAAPAAFPVVFDGVKGLAFLEAASSRSANSGCWEAIEYPGAAAGHVLSGSRHPRSSLHSKAPPATIDHSQIRIPSVGGPQAPRPPQSACE